MSNLARELRTPAERTRHNVALAFSIVFWIALVVTVIPALYGLMIAAGVAIAHALFLAHVRGNGVRIGPRQLPAIWNKVVRASAKLGLPQPPEVIVVQAGGVLNAFATKLLGRRFIILHSEIIDACRLVSGPAVDDAPDELDFVIGHEIGHLAAGHLRWWLLPARLIPLLGPAYSRACEYTCDRCGHAAVGDLRRSARALAVLAAGGRCAAQVDLDELAMQRSDAGHFWSAVYELNASHPYVSKRIAALRAHAGEPLAPDAGRNFMSYPLAPMFGFAVGGAQNAVVVAAMIGVMAALAIPAFRKYIERSKAAAAQSRSSDSSSTAMDLIAGDKFRWSLRSPGASWVVLPTETARKNNPLADRWLTRADVDAHVLVIGEPNTAHMSIDQLERAVLGNLQHSTESLRVAKRVDLPRGRLVYLTAKVNGMEIAYRYGLFVTPQSAYQVLAFAPAQSIAAIEPELLTAVQSFVAE